eukprot:9217304-Pyramimonas_sp.AAC.1
MGVVCACASITPRPFGPRKAGPLGPQWPTRGSRSTVSPRSRRISFGNFARAPRAWPLRT